MRRALPVARAPVPACLFARASFPPSKLPNSPCRHLQTRWANACRPPMFRPLPANLLAARYKFPIPMAPLTSQTADTITCASEVLSQTLSYSRSRVLSVAFSAQMAAPISLVSLAVQSGDPDCSKCNDDVNKCDCK